MTGEVNQPKTANLEGPQDSVLKTAVSAGKDLVRGAVSDTKELTRDIFRAVPDLVQFVGAKFRGLWEKSQTDHMWLPRKVVQSAVVSTAVKAAMLGATGALTVEAMVPYLAVTAASVGAWLFAKHFHNKEATHQEQGGLWKFLKEFDDYRDRRHPGAFSPAVAIA